MLSIRRLLLLVQLALAVALLAAGLRSWRAEEDFAARFGTLRAEVVAPLGHLKALADAYTVSEVGLAHKVRNGGFTMQEGRTGLAAAEAAIAKATADVERRASPRVAIDAPVTVSRPGGQPQKARLVNLSAGGVGLQDCQGLPVGTTVAIALPAGGPPAPATVLGAEGKLVRLGFAEPGLTERRVAALAEQAGRRLAA